MEKELDLFKFLNDKNIAMRWDEEHLSTWLHGDDLESFSQIVSSYLEESGMNAHLCADGKVWIDLVPVCEHYGIDPDRISPNKDN